MKKIRILVVVIIMSVCIQSIATGAAFSDTADTTEPTTTEETTNTDPQTKEATSAASEIQTPVPEKENEASDENKDVTETVQMEDVELNLLQSGSMDPENYDINVINTTQEVVAASELEPKAMPSASLESHIAAGMDKYSSRIDISGYGLSSSDASKKKVFKAITNAINNNPRLFFVGNKLTIGSGGGKVLAVYPQYTMSTSKADSMKKSFDAAVGKALDTVSSSMSADQKAKAIHNYIIKNAEYDMVNYKKKTVPIDSYRANGVLVKGVGVCQSYAMAYKYIMEKKLGISCKYASTNSHIWNMVKIGSKYYNVDTTWDDGGKSKVYYSYFLVGKSTMVNAHKKKSINFETTSSSTSFGTPSKIGLKSVKGAKRAAAVTWGKATTASGYQVYYSAKKTSGFKYTKAITKNSTVKYTKKSLKKGKKYYFKVRAYKVVNGKKLYGSFSTAKYAKVK